MFLDFDDFQGYRFADAGTYESCNVADILQTGAFREISAPDLVARYSSSGAYVHRLDTFAGELSANTLSNLHLAKARRQIVLFKTNSQQWFTFGYEAGAVITHTNQTADGFGSVIVATSNSIYPLFEYNGEVITTDGGGDIMVMGAYPSDEAAALDGLEIDDIYELTVDNIYGLPEGVLKRRKI